MFVQALGQGPPRSPARDDLLVIEGTCGDRLHEDRKTRRQRLQAICEHAFGNRGTRLIPAFGIGRTQELLHEQEAIVLRHAGRPATQGVTWGGLDIIVDSPPAADFTAGIHAIGGFSAHADQKNLLDFIRRIPRPPRERRVVHGDAAAKATLARQVREQGLTQTVHMPSGATPGRETP